MHFVKLPSGQFVNLAAISHTEKVSVISDLTVYFNRPMSQTREYLDTAMRIYKTEDAIALLEALNRVSVIP